MRDQIGHERIEHVAIDTDAVRRLWADDVEGTYETLRARGVEFVAAPKKEPWGTSVIFKDSEGNQLHLGSR